MFYVFHTMCAHCFSASCIDNDVLCLLFTPDSTFSDVNMIPCLSYIVSVVRRRHFSYDSPNFYVCTFHVRIQIPYFLYTFSFRKFYFITFSGKPCKFTCVSYSVTQKHAKRQRRLSLQLISSRLRLKVAQGCFSLPAVTNIFCSLSSI